MSNVTAIYQAAIAELIRVRKRAGLTQAAIAERMGTKQAAIARLEAKVDGSFSLRRYADYAIACGYIPCAFESERIAFHCIPLEDARAFTVAYPQAILTWTNYLRWKIQEAWKDVEPLPYPTISDMRPGPVFTTSHAFSANGGLAA